MADPEKKPDGNKPEGENPAPFKDKPRPFSIYRDENQKTNAALKEANAARKTVDDKYNGLNSALQPALDAYARQLKEASAPRITVRKEAVDKLSSETGAVELKIEELQKKLVEEREKLWRSQDSLRGAQKELAGEVAKVDKENAAAHKTRAAEMGKEVAEAARARKDVYKATGKTIRREHWNTFKRTTKESAAFLPDLSMRFARAAKRALVEAFHVFNRSAKKASEGFREPTSFSITREKPLPGTEKPVKKPAGNAPDAPKA